MPCLTRRRWLLGAALAGLVITPALASRVVAGGHEEPRAPADGEQDELETSPVAAEPGELPYGTPPASLAIPKLGVEARVVGVAQDDDGAMSAPADPDEVAWYTLGPGMGVDGNAVFAGHVDFGGRPRVFGRLAALNVGDAVLVVDAAGDGYEYRVESSTWVRAEGAPVEEIFGQTDTPKITLITCGGAYNPARREYLDRLIVRAAGT